MLGPTREYDEYDDNESDSNHQRIGESAQVIADVEDETNGYHYAYQYGEHERQTVAIALGP